MQRRPLLRHLFGVVSVSALLKWRRARRPRSVQRRSHQRRAESLPTERQLPKTETRQNNAHGMAMPLFAPDHERGAERLLSSGIHTDPLKRRSGMVGSSRKGENSNTAGEWEKRRECAGEGRGSRWDRRRRQRRGGGEMAMVSYTGDSGESR